MNTSSVLLDHTWLICRPLHQSPLALFPPMSSSSHCLQASPHAPDVAQSLICVFPLQIFGIFVPVLVMDLHMGLALLIASTSGLTVTIRLTFWYCSLVSSPSWIPIPSNSEMLCKRYILLLPSAEIFLFTAVMKTPRHSLMWGGCCAAGLEKCRTEVKALEGQGYWWPLIIEQKFWLYN